MKTTLFMCNECHNTFEGYVKKKIKSLMKFVPNCNHHSKLKDKKEGKES